MIPAVERPSRAPDLTSMLSGAFVAFTIECDNEFEARMPHHTNASSHAEAAGTPWVVSMAMWMIGQ